MIKIRIRFELSRRKRIISSKDHITNTVTITATGKDGKSISKTVTVNQVIRLVDPIAFYKKWDNRELVKVKVREFNKEKRKYEILNSIGPWTATITAGDWFTLSTDDGQSVVGTSKSVTGTGGDIVFNYKPNSSTGSSSTNRYGAIKVTYHNNRLRAYDLFASRLCGYAIVGWWGNLVFIQLYDKRLYHQRSDPIWIFLSRRGFRFLLYTMGCDLW